jgi:ATP synthase protein I
MDTRNEQGVDLQAIIFHSLGLATQISGVVIVAVLGSMFLGLWIDRQLGSSPWAVLLLLGLGTLVAVAGCYRVVAPVAANMVAGQGDEWEAALSWKQFLRSMAFVVRIGLVTVAPPLAGLFLGLWLDAWLDTRPWVTLTLTVGGSIAGLVGAWRLSSTFLKRMTQSSSQEENV